MCEIENITAEALVDWGHDVEGAPLPPSAAYYLPTRDDLRVVLRSCHPTLTKDDLVTLLDRATEGRCVLLPWDAAHEFAAQVQERAEYAMKGRCTLQVTVTPHRGE